jgi:hypothetical protein
MEYKIGSYGEFSLDFSGALCQISAGCLAGIESIQVTSLSSDFRKLGALCGYARSTSV